MAIPFKELVTPITEYTMVCRGCLAESGEMKNIYEWGLHEEFAKFTDVQIRRADGISELICAACEESLTLCKNFRSQCQQTDLLLRNNLMNKPVEDVKGNTVTNVLEEKTLTINITAPDDSSKIYLNCPYCHEKYLKKKDLSTHLSRIHNKSLIIEVKYYCNIDNCSYSINLLQKSFSGRKYLNQHSNKVHKDRLFVCDYCSSSYSTNSEYIRHLSSCNLTFNCELCNLQYKTHERLLVHIMRHHPDLHKSYKEKRAEKRKANSLPDSKKIKHDTEYICDSPKRSFATQTSGMEHNLRNDVNFSTWPRNDFEIKKDEISTQTVFEDLLSLKSQSEDESLFETVSLSDIQTQTFPIEFGLTRSNKETLTEIQSPDLSIKETQTCFCHDSPLPRLLDSISSSPLSMNFTSTETQTAEFKSALRTDVLLSCSSAQTQTSFDNEGSL